MKNVKHPVMKSVTTFGVTVCLCVASSGVFAAPGQMIKRHFERAGFERVDQNQDGFVSEAELIDVLQRKSARAFNYLDSNNNDLIELEEALARREHVLGLLEGTAAPEIKACVEESVGITLPPIPEPGEKFSQADADNSGTIDAIEWDNAVSQGVSQRFALIDADGDLLLDKEDFAALKAQKQALRAAMRACVGAMLDF